MAKNILIVISQIWLWNWGAEKTASEISIKLKKKWYKIKFLTFYDYQEKYPYAWEYKSLNEKFHSFFFV